MMTHWDRTGLRLAFLLVPFLGAAANGWAASGLGIKGAGRRYRIVMVTNVVVVVRFDGEHKAKCLPLSFADSITLDWRRPEVLRSRSHGG
jgi:hypothetical protein